jgi:hypothetical protein
MAETACHPGHAQRSQSTVVSDLHHMTPLICGGRLEVPKLFRRPRRPIVLLALLALLVAQGAAGIHLLSHSVQRSDPSAPQVQHAPLCLECAAYAPLGALHSGGAAAFAVAAPAADQLAGASVDFRVETGPGVRFRSRAPPR